MTDSFDLVVIGSGPGGYVAAIRAAQLGLKVGIVEQEKLGGVCLNWGCIPTKALLRTAEIYHHMRNADAFGLDPHEASFDIAKVVDRSRKVAGQLNAGVKSLMKKNKITVFEGRGALKSAGVVAVSKADETLELAARNIIIATGARARELSFAPADGDRIWTYRHAMTPKVMPANLLVVGSGAIGVEFASFYGDMGGSVSIVEMKDRILPLEDPDISAFMAKAVEKRGMTILCGTTLEGLQTTDDGVNVTLRTADGTVKTDAYSHVIVAIGIVPNTEQLGLDALGVSTVRGHIETDEFGRTSSPGIWAIGDVTAPPWLAHKASHDGVIAAEAIAGGHPHPLNRLNIPACTYSRPQVASVGLTEEAALAAGYSVRVGVFPFFGNGKAIALGEPEGLVKTVFDAETGELLGAHMVGAEVTELIEGYTIARHLEATEAELADVVFPHPTLSEAMHESVLAAFARALHL